MFPRPPAPPTVSTVFVSKTVKSPKIYRFAPVVAWRTHSGELESNGQFERRCSASNVKENAQNLLAVAGNRQRKIRYHRTPGYLANVTKARSEAVWYIYPVGRLVYKMMASR